MDIAGSVINIDNFENDIQPYVQSIQTETVGYMNEQDVFVPLETVNDSIAGSVINASDLNKLIFFIPGENLEFGFLDEDGNLAMAETIEDDVNTQQMQMSQLTILYLSLTSTTQ